MPMIDLTCPCCEKADVLVKDWRYSHTQFRDAPWAFCAKCKWRGFLTVSDK